MSVGEKLDHLLALNKKLDDAVTAERVARDVYEQTEREMRLVRDQLGADLFSRNGKLYRVNTYGFVIELPVTKVEG